MTIRELISQIHSILAEDTERYDEQISVLEISVEWTENNIPRVVLRLKDD